MSVETRLELIMVAFNAAIAGLAGLEASARNQDRQPDSKLPFAAVYDGDDDTEDTGSDGRGPHVVVATPFAVISFMEVPENVGPLLSEWTAKAQKAVLFDAPIAALAGATTGGRSRGRRGAFYRGRTAILNKGRSTVVDLTLRFRIVYPLIPGEL